MTTATEVGYVEMRMAKVVGLSGADDEPFHQYVVLEDVAGDRHLAIEIRQPEAFSLAALGQAPIFAAPGVLQEAEARTVGTVGM